jgi:subtilisin-like proprotein convertase family protein
MTLKCNIVDGLMPTEKIAHVEAADGQIEEISVSTKNLNNDTLIASEIARHQGRVLVELPRESAAGHWRIWVKESAVGA